MFAGLSESFATVEMEVLKTFKTEDKILDVAMAGNGKWIYMLTDKGEVLIYTTRGDLRDRIFVGKSIEGIKMGSREDILLLTNREDSTVQIVLIDIIYNIDIEGSPYKGPVDAPVTIVVFNDFE
jgi:hypothetical protein